MDSPGVPGKRLRNPTRYDILYRAKRARPKGMHYGVPGGYTLSREARPPEGHALRCAGGGRGRAELTEIDRERNKGALRRGYTTGTCAAAAAQAAAWMLLAGTRVEKAAVTLPGGMRLELAVEEERSGAG